jgi:uncharacterized protein (DUF2126 family)
MGGEPTFVAVDDMQGLEWNLAALGPTKRDYAEKLIRRLRERFATGRPAALRPGQVVSGREPAALGLRRVLAQRRRAALAQSGPDRSRDAEVAGDGGRCRALCRGARQQLGLPPGAAMAAYEDPVHFMLAEQKLPVGINPEDNKLPIRASASG